MGAFAGLLFGTGTLLVWLGLATPAPIVKRRPGPTKLAVVLAEAGLPGIRPAQVVTAQVLTGLLMLAVAFVVTGSVSISAVFSLFASYLPWLLIRRLRRKRRADLRELWPEVVDNLTSGVRAGLSLPEALGTLGIRGPEALRQPFTRFGADYRATGDFNDSLSRLKEALADPVGDRVCESLRIAREVGGADLGRILTSLSTFLREEGRARAELLTRQSWSVTAARMAVAAPWLVLLLLATRRETLAAYDTAAGGVILAVGGALSIAAYQIMVRIGRLPEDRRVLR